MPNPKTITGRPSRRAFLRYRAAGVTLTEAVIAVALLGFGLAGSLQALNFINGMAAVSRNQTSARILAQTEMDRLLNLVYSPPTSVPLTFSPVAQPNSSPVTIYTPEGGSTTPITGTLTTLAAPLNPSDPRTPLRLTVTVSYTYRGRTYNTVMASVRAPDI